LLSPLFKRHFALEAQAAFSSVFAKIEAHKNARFTFLASFFINTKIASFLKTEN